MKSYSTRKKRQNLRRRQLLSSPAGHANYLLDKVKASISESKQPQVKRQTMKKRRRFCTPRRATDSLPAFRLLDRFPRYSPTVQGLRKWRISATIKAIEILTWLLHCLKTIQHCVIKLMLLMKTPCINIFARGLTRNLFETSPHRFDI